jgi:ketosteroid isomerase-like protein
MARGNLEAASEVVDAVARRDLTRLIELADPEVEWQPFATGLLEEGVYRGHDGIRRYVSDLDDAWEILRAEVDGGLEVGSVVLLVGRLRYRGRGSGVETDLQAGWVVRFRDGRMVAMRAFRDPERAIEGLR